MRTSLRDAEVSPPEDGWECLERVLSEPGQAPAAPVPVRKPAWRIYMPRIAAAAAVVLIGTVVGDLLLRNGTKRGCYRDDGGRQCRGKFTGTVAAAGTASGSAAAGRACRTRDGSSRAAACGGREERPYGRGTDGSGSRSRDGDSGNGKPVARRRKGPSGGGRRRTRPGCGRSTDNICLAARIPDIGQCFGLVGRAVPRNGAPGVPGAETAPSPVVLAFGGRRGLREYGDSRDGLRQSHDGCPAERHALDDRQRCRDGGAQALRL